MKEQKEKKRARLQSLRERKLAKEEEEKEKRQDMRIKMRERKQNQKEKEKEKLSAQREREKEKKRRDKEHIQQKLRETKFQNQVHKWKDPNTPKRPPTPFFVFIKEKRPSVLAENKNLKNTELSVLLGKKWKELNETDKQPYLEKSLQEREKYKKVHEEYKKKNDAPRPPLSPFFAFRREHGGEKAKSLVEAQRAMTETGKVWRALNQAEKKKHLDRYQKEKEKYEKELAHWTEKQIHALPKAAQKIVQENIEGNDAARRSKHGRNEREIRVIIQNALREMKRESQRRAKQ